MSKKANKPTYKTYTSEDFEKAIQSVNDGTSQRKAARYYGVPQATLSDHLRGRVQDGAEAGRKPLFPRQVENLIADKCNTAAEMGLGISRIQVMQKAGRLAKEMKLKTNFKNNMPGKDWWYGFKRRNPAISLRTPEKLTSVRARGLNPEKVGNYLIDLQKLIKDNRLEDHPECVWNMDEKGVSMEHSPSKVVAFKGSRTVPGRVGNSRESNTFIACINANGESMSPLIIVKGKTEKSVFGFNTIMEPRGARWTYQKNAWTEDLLGVEWFSNIFLKECGTHRPQILVLDGHHSHEVLGLIDAARKNNIYIMALPPHTTHYLCPLDRCVFGPFSTNYNQACSEFCQDPKNIVNKISWPGLFSNAYYKSFTKENITSGFRACSIFPCNPLVIPTEAFAPSLASDISKTSGSHPLEWVVRKVQGPIESLTNITEEESTCPINFPFITDQSASVLMPVDTEERNAVESLLALETSLEKSDEVLMNIAITSPSDTIDLPLSLSLEETDAQLPSTLADWNESVESMFSVSSPPPKKSKITNKVTSHRLLTSETILEQKRDMEQKKQRKAFEKENRLKQKELLGAKKLIESQLKGLRSALSTSKNNTEHQINPV